MTAGGAQPGPATAGAVSQAAVITVDDSGGADYTSIQAAVNNAAAGDRIEVQSGTYRESVTVDKTLTLVAPSGATLNGSTLGNGVDGVDIAGSASPTIEGLTITGFYRGVDARASGSDNPGSTGDWTLRDLTVRNSGFGAVHASGTPGDWTIDDSTIMDDGGNDAVDASDATGDWAIRDSTLTSRVYAQNTSGQWVIENVLINDSFNEGVVARESDSTWRIRDTTIRGVGIGISAGSSTAAWTVENTTVLNTWQTGIGADRTEGDWTVRGSTVRNSSDYGVNGFRSTGNWTVTNSTVEENGLNGVNGRNASGDWTVWNSTIRNNSGAGISAFEASATWEVHESAIVGNGNEGIDATYSGGGFATRNWWGACDGPSGAFSGSGDEVTRSISITPYYTDAAQTTLSNETASPCSTGSLDVGLELEQTESVDQGNDVNITTWSNNRKNSRESGVTLDLFVDADGDNQFESGEIEATRTVDLGASAYETWEMEFANVQLSAGTYEYATRASKNGHQNWSFTNGTLTVNASGSGVNIVVRTEQRESVQQGNDVNITAWIDNRMPSTAISGATVELLVDSDGDGSMEASEVVATRSASLPAYGYNGFNVTYASVGLSNGTYDYTSRVNYSGVTTRSSTNGTLTVGNASGTHQSGVPMALYDAIAGPDGQLSRSEIISMVQQYATTKEVNGVPLTRSDVIALVSHYITR